MNFAAVNWHDSGDWEDDPCVRYRAYTFPGAIVGVQTVVRTCEVWKQLGLKPGGAPRCGWMIDEAVTSALRHVRCARRRFPYIHADALVEPCSQADFTEVWTLADEAPDALPVD